MTRSLDQTLKSFILADIIKWDMTYFFIKLWDLAEAPQGEICDLEIHIEDIGYFGDDIGYYLLKDAFKTFKLSNYFASLRNTGNKENTRAWWN